MESVAVLLSTYNGEKYLVDLLESVISQKDVEVHIFVRDDGSTDSTKRILDKYKSQIDEIIYGDNIGPAQSFLQLVRNTEGFSYYAYCDQDDIWYSKKLAYATNRLRDSSEERALFISSYDVVDEDLKLLLTYDMEFERPLLLSDTIIYRSPSGCTMVFNEELRNLIAISNPDFVRMHDFWTLLVAESFHANIITEQIPLLKYRQHSENTVGIVPSTFTRINRLITSALYGNNERYRQVKNLLVEYSELMPDDSKAIVKKVVDYRASIRKRFQLAFDKTFRTGNLPIDILFKVSVITGLF